MSSRLTKLSTKNYMTFRSILIIYSRRFNIQHEDAEEMVNDSILKALDNFDNDRGSFEGFCKVILKNKILNFKKTRIHLFLLILIDEYENYITADEDTIEDKEKNLRAIKFINTLNMSLDDNEARFLNELYKTCESSEKLSISKASKSFGITTLKGWDLFRKIQRKAEKILMVLKSKENKISDEDKGVLYCKIHEPIYKISDYKILHSDLEKEKIQINFTPDQIEKLNSIYNFEY